ncbi:hypothetical protein E4U09_004585 [Claviceps aff. purpurea]|uniref:Uncharacterized protein n=1 Tax=Claviceps aff. purpurea TaxID=1967640 RepID=A0A9P7QHT1_9HYPO|nr:hypothetical protein E4U09_004585 [Claviceps aff. purpurea]
MLDELDRPVIIDFDSWGHEGQKLEDGMKKGALEWSINGSSYEYALFANDNYGLSKLREFIYDPSSGKPLAKSTSANSSQTFTSSTTSSGGPQDVTGRVRCVWHKSGVTRRGRQTEYHHPATAQGEGKKMQVLGLGQDKGTGR